jgi:hypothetical protein
MEEVVDRLVQQAIWQVLEPILDPTFSATSFGFRVGRGAHDALAPASRDVAEGRTSWTRNSKPAGTASALMPTIATSTRDRRRLASGCWRRSPRCLQGKLRVRVNHAKSAVAHVSERKFLQPSAPQRRQADDRPDQSRSSQGPRSGDHTSQSRRELRAVDWRTQLAAEWLGHVLPPCGSSWRS